jgi:outer membrane protein TolC
VWAGHFPTIDAQIGVQKWRDHSQASVNAGLTVNQLVYSPTLAHDYKAARADTQRQELVTETTKLDIRHVVEVEFLKSWQLQQQEESMQALYASSELLFKEAQHKNELKLLDKTDWLQSTSDHAKDLSTYYSYNDDVTIAQRKLEYLLGYSVHLQRLSHTKKGERQCMNAASSQPMDLSWDGSKQIVLYNLETYMISAFKCHPALKEILKRVETEQQRVKSLRKTALPSLSVSASTGFDNQYTYDTTHDNTYYNIGFGVTWNIFDGLVNRYKERSEQAKLLQERLNYDAKVQEITSAIETAFYTLSKSMTNLQAQQIEFERAKNEFERRKEEMCTGIISRVDFKTAQSIWEKARYQWITARVDAATKESDLLYACGYPSVSELEKKRSKPEGV